MPSLSLSWWTTVVDFGGMPFDANLVAFFSVEVGDHIVSESIDPVVMDFVVILTGNAVHSPVDGAVVIDVFENDVSRLALIMCSEVESVGACASGEDIVGFDGLIGIVGSRWRRLISLIRIIFAAV